MFKLFAKKKQKNKEVEKYEDFVEKMKYLRGSIYSSIEVLKLDTATKYKKGQLCVYCNIYTYLDNAIENITESEEKKND